MIQKGFTLIELMIVIAVLLILFSAILTSSSCQHMLYQDLSTCEFIGLDNYQHSQFKCPDGKIYSN